MAKQLTSFTTAQGTVITNAYARVVRPAMPRPDSGTGESVTLVTCDFSIYDSKAVRDAGKPPYVTESVSIVATDDLFASIFGAAPTGASTFAGLFAKSYALLTQHPDTQALLANSLDV